MLTLTTLLSLSLLAPAGGAYTRDELKEFAATASREFSRMESRCSTLTPGAPADLEAEASFRGSADLMEIVVRHETYPAGRQGQNLRSDDVGSFAQSLERAYLCHPGWEQRHYLDRAIHTLEARLTQIRDVERRSQSEPDGLILQQVRERLLALTRALTLPPPPPCPLPAAPEANTRRTPDEADAQKPRPYRAKYMDLFSLRVEIGFGLGTQFIDGSPKPEYRDTFLFGVAPGVRFLLGRHKRHVLATGFRWSVLAFKSDDNNDSDTEDENHRVNQMVARFEYGIRLHERWFSLHAAFEPGIQARAQITSFGTPQVGGSGAVCTGNEVFCVRFGGYSGTLGGDWGLDGMFMGAGIDIFRFTDNILLRRAER